MARKPVETVRCQICGKQKKLSEVRPAAVVREPLVEMIRQTYPDWSAEGYICHDDLNKFREQYVTDVMARGKGELTSLEQEVMKSLQEHEVLSRNVNEEFERKLSLGERMADGLASAAGSWRFIIIFMLVLALWIIGNTVLLLRHPFDPYPFILLNLVLSCIAAIQAPVIMMSQNRQEAKDRLRSQHDYQVNLKAELEIRHLHEKLDHLLSHQWERLIQIQEIQLELLNELENKK